MSKHHSSREDLRGGMGQNDGEELSLPNKLRYKLLRLTFNQQFSTPLYKSIL